MSTADEAFALREIQDAHVTVLELHGDLDIAASDPLQTRLGELKAAGTPAVLDLSHVGFMDSSGLACVTNAVRAARRDNWDLTVARELSGQVRRLLELVDGATLFWPPH